MYYIFPNNEYTITWLSEDGIKKTTGLVTAVSGKGTCGTVTMKVLQHNGNDDGTDVFDDQCYCINAYNTRSNDPYAAARVAEMKKQQDLSKCPVLQDKDQSKYDAPAVVTIPIANISEVEYDLSSQQYPCLPPDNTPKGGTKIVILGISATTIRAVIIRLEFLGDNCPCDNDDVVKVIDMQVGKKYNVTYVCNDADKTVYEIEGVLTQIIETGSPDEDKPDNCKGTSTGNYQNSFVRQGKKTEQVGFNNSSYNCSCSRDDFMHAEPIINDVKFTFDTSEQFASSEEVVWLSMIRNVDLVDTGTPDEPEDSDDKHGHHHGHHPEPVKPEPTVYHIGRNTVIVDGGSVLIKGHHDKIHHHGQDRDVTVTMQEILKYYLGV